MTDETTKTPGTEPGTGADETFGWTGDGDGSSEPGGPATGRDWIGQLQHMIENITEQAGPVLREVSAKAAELAAVAGEKAGPVAARAAELTAEAGTKLAERSRDLAAELRRDQTARTEGATTAEPPTTSAPEAPAETTSEDAPPA